MRISDWSSDVCSSDLVGADERRRLQLRAERLEDGALDLFVLAGRLDDDVAVGEHLKAGAGRDALQSRLLFGLADLPSLDLAVHVLGDDIERLLRLLGGDVGKPHVVAGQRTRSEEHPSELKSLMRIPYAVL